MGDTCDVRKSEILIYNLFFKTLNNICDYHADTTSFYRSCNAILMIGRCMDAETTLFIYLTYMPEYDVSEPLLKT